MHGTRDQLFPVPDSPFINTVILLEDSLPIALKTSCIAGASPIISVSGKLSSLFDFFS